MTRSTPRASRRAVHAAADAKRRGASGRCSLLALRANEELRERLRRKEPRHVGNLERRLDAIRRDFGQEATQRREARVGHDALLLERGFREVAPRILDDLAARD